MEVYDYYKENLKKNFKRNITGGIIAGLVLAVIVVAVIVSSLIYLDIIQLDEIGKSLSSIYIKNIKYQVIFSLISFLMIFVSLSITSLFARKIMSGYFKQNNLKETKLPVFSVSAGIAVVGAFLCRNLFYQNLLSYLNWKPFGVKDPLFGKDIGYYVFQRPFLMSIYDFVSALWVFVIIYTLAYYSLALFSVFKNFTVENLKYKSIIRHNLINISLFFIIKTFSYKFEKEGLLFGNFANVNGAGFVDNNIMKWYFTAAPFILAAIVLAAVIFIWVGRLKNAAITIAVFPSIWIIVLIVSFVIQVAIVKPNELDKEKEYLRYNIEQTRAAYNINSIKSYEFPKVENLTPASIEKNKDDIDNIRVVDYKATLDSDKQLQSLTNFYTFHDGDIINYNIGGKETPVFIAAREINKDGLSTKNYTNNMFKYTHGYGVVINPINRFTNQGQAEFIMSGLESSNSSGLKITEPRIYYGELTNDYVVVNPQSSGKLKETDNDGNSETNYDIKNGGGIKLGLLNKLLFSLKYGDFNMLVSGNINSESKILLNREIVSRAQKAVPFLSVDNDPYMILTNEGRLKWVLDAYTTTQYYPYSQAVGGYNYIRNSVKIVIDAYLGTVDYYIIDKNDPIIQVYDKMYPGIFKKGDLPADIKEHMRYPEMLFKIQTEMMKRYHITPDSNQNITNFYGNQDMWKIATMPEKGSSEETDIEPYYNMINLPGNFGKGNEFILMRPFTPSGAGKHNLVSWLAVKNSSEEYGQLILYRFPKNADNIFGPYQVEVKINQIDSISKDMTLWGQSGSEVFKGNLLVIPLDNSVFYVEPIYIKSSGQAIPEVREIVVGYQSGNDFRHGIGKDLNSAIQDLFAGLGQQMPTTPTTPTTPVTPGTENQQGTPDVNQDQTNQKLIDEILNKYNSLKQQMDELDKLMSELKSKNQ